MNEELFHILTPVDINGNLRAAVSHLQTELPEGANGVVVIVYVDGLHELEGARINDLPVRFDPVMGRLELVGTVTLGFGVGNLE